MTEQTQPGLEAALRDAADRAMKAETPLSMAIGFFMAVAGLARCLRDCRKAAGLPRGLSPELTLLLERVCIAACDRMTVGNTTNADALRLARSIERLSRAAFLSQPVPEKPKKTAAKPAAQRPAPPARPRERPADYNGIGAIAIRAQDTAVATTPRFEAAFRQFLAEKNTLPRLLSRP